MTSDRPPLSEPAKTLIRQLARRLGRRPTPEEVIDAARPKDSPLHPYFDWGQSGRKEELRKRREIVRDNADA
jgi:hypothetical protein